MDQLSQILDGLHDIRERQRSHEQAINRLTDAVVRLAVIEERQAVVVGNLERVEDKLDSVDKRLDALEQQEVLNKQSRYWVFGLLTLTATAVLYAVFRIVGLS